VQSVGSYYLAINSYMFRPLFWPSSGR